MEAILIHPEDAAQLKTVKAVLKALNVQFEAQSATLPAYVKKSIEQGLKQFEAGQTIGLDEFKARHLTKNDL